MLVPLLAACVVFGFLDELRDYYEVYPVIVMLMMPTVARWMGVTITTRQESAPREPWRQWLRGEAGVTWTSMVANRLANRVHPAVHAVQQVRFQVVTERHPLAAALWLP